MMISATKKRFNQYNKLRGKQTNCEEFWDIVVLTAADSLQKEVYEAQLEEKLSRGLLPSCSDYLVVADPPGHKIGNGGSTLVTLQSLHERYGAAMRSKKAMVIHAGGFSQRFPSASVMGKVFVAMPTGEPIMDMLDVKLASYIDLPAKMEAGGLFVCCSDTLEVYHDGGRDWRFSVAGFTALAHPSSLRIGSTHGVFVLEPDEDGGLVRRCRRFLHKPSVTKMRSTAGCVATGRAGEEFVFTDSAFFMSASACDDLLSFHRESGPPTCELDAYGDFLQSLGSEADDGYVGNTRNVVAVTGSLTETRRRVFERLRGTPLSVVALASPFDENVDCDNTISSHFYHFGTSAEYLELLTEDEQLADMLSFEPLAYCRGVPFSFTTRSQLSDGHCDFIEKVAVLDLKGAAEQKRGVAALPRVMASLVLAGVVVGRGAVIEHCRLRECVRIGPHCIVSNCSLPQRASLPPYVFLHTAAVDAASLGCRFDVGYVTVVFGVRDDLKRSCRKSEAGTALTYLAAPLHRAFAGDPFPGRGDDVTVSLWTARLFSVHETMEASAQAACDFLEGARADPVGGLVSMEDVVRRKSVGGMLRYRRELGVDIGR